MANAEITLQVQGMRCGHCEKAVTAAIKARDPAAEVRVDLPQGMVHAITRLPRAELAALITEEGYQVAA